jgi:hypothetical protein
MVRAGYSNPPLNVLSRILARMGARKLLEGKIGGGLDTAASRTRFEGTGFALARHLGNAY